MISHIVLVKIYLLNVKKTSSDHFAIYFVELLIYRISHFSNNFKTQKNRYLIHGTSVFH